jgi:hypothetical protein
MNSKGLQIGALAAVVAIAGVVAFSNSAMAQTPGPTQTPSYGPGAGMMAGGRMGNGMGMMGGRAAGIGGPANSLVAVAARTLNISQADLVTALNTGKTVADVAKDKDVALDKIVDAFIAPRVEMLKSAVAAGRLTQAQADANLATMKANISAQLNAKFTPRGGGAGTGMGTGFMDSDGDGVCDNMPANGQAGAARGPMNRGGRWSR